MAVYRTQLSPPTNRKSDGGGPDSRDVFDVFDDFDDFDDDTDGGTDGGTFGGTFATFDTDGGTFDGAPFGGDTFDGSQRRSEGRGGKHRHTQQTQAFVSPSSSFRRGSAAPGTQIFGSPAELPDDGFADDDTGDRCHRQPHSASTSPLSPPAATSLPSSEFMNLPSIP
jgi:hypothetical protein